MENKEYDQKTLRKLQLIELTILKDFIALCQKHKLHYFALWGTAIGALRHKGFIPWDDDIDVCLTRKEYDLFLKYAKEELSDKYDILNQDTTLEYPLFFTRLMLKNTTFKTIDVKDMKYKQGIYLEIYAFDNIPDDESLYKKQGKKVWFYSHLFIIRNEKLPIIKGNKVKVFFMQIICFILHYLLIICGISRKFIYNKTMHYLTMYNNIKTKRCAYLTDISPFINTINYKDLFPTVLLDFEDIKLSFPNNMHQLMTDQYGDYITLPPMEQRKNHYPIELDFGEYDEK